MKEKSLTFTIQFCQGCKLYTVAAVTSFLSPVKYTVKTRKTGMMWSKEKAIIECM